MVYDVGRISFIKLALLHIKLSLQKVLSVIGIPTFHNITEEKKSLHISEKIIKTSSSDKLFVTPRQSESQRRISPSNSVFQKKKLVLSL